MQCRGDRLVGDSARKVGSGGSSRGCRRWRWLRCVPLSDGTRKASMSLSGRIKELSISSLFREHRSEFSTHCTSQRQQPRSVLLRHRANNACCSCCQIPASASYAQHLGLPSDVPIQSQPRNWTQLSDRRLRIMNPPHSNSSHPILVPCLFLILK